ncbi:MAG: hypothetical protein QG595_830 [Pseudomonadota bacterium]|jgi:uncharacterized protein (DUF1015 family)|nr:hypothetical protein [Pseudomonadota bacterium]
MSTLIRPFRALRPVPEQAAAVAAPPYDVLNSAEARTRAAGRPFSFLHISKPEIDLPEDTDPYAAEVYAKGAANLHALIEAGVLIRDRKPCYYIYRLQMGEHVQTGIACVGSVAEYDRNRIRKHEFTRPDKEDDRVRQISALNAQTGPVLLAYRANTALGAIISTATQGAPFCDVVADDGVRHTLWILDEELPIRRITQIVNAMEALYIADGHHRSASASRVAAQRAAANPRHDGDEDYNHFLCVAFPHDEMRILDYNRLVKDLHGQAAKDFLARISRQFTVTAVAGQARPGRVGQFGLYLDKRWYQLDIKPELIPADPVASLDVSLLQEHLLAPVLGIGDPRRDKRIDFVGGIRGLSELERRVDSGEMAVAFALFPTSLEALMAVADANQVMPPKSTWFEPKLADGLLSHLLD